jgi:hypothetical protein
VIEIADPASLLRAFYVVGVVALVALPLGSILARRGSRGRRVGDGPHCRRCDYDLRGLPGEPLRCPECGAHLRLPRAVAIGYRVRRKASLYAGLTLLAFALPAAVMDWRLGVRAFGHDVNKPAWWLMRELAGNDPAVRSRAAAEFQRRVEADQLAQDRVDAAVDRCLALQADLTTPWDPRLGDLVQSAWAKFRLDKGRWQAYAVQSAMPKLQARSKVRKGDDLPAVFWLASPRAGSKGSPFSIWGSMVDVSVSGIPGDTERTWSADAITRVVQLRDDRFGRLKIGPNRLQLLINLNIQTTNVWVGDYRRTVTADWELVAADAATVELIDDPATRAAVAGQIVVRSVVHRGRPDELLVAEFNANPGPIDLAVEVLAFSEGQTYPMGTVDFNAGWHGEFWAQTGIPGFKARKVDLIVRGSANAARRTVRMTKVWGGELRFRDVPVRYPEVEGVP